MLNSWPLLETRKQSSDEKGKSETWPVTVQGILGLSAKLRLSFPSLVISINEPLSHNAYSLTYAGVAKLKLASLDMYSFSPVEQRDSNVVKLVVRHAMRRICLI